MTALVTDTVTNIIKIRAVQRPSEGQGLEVKKGHMDLEMKVKSLIDQLITNVFFKTQ